MSLKIKTLLILLAILIVLFAAVSFSAPPPADLKNGVLPPAPTQIMPTPAPSPTSTTVTINNNGQTIDLNVGDTFLLKLGDTMNWNNIQISDPSVISREVNVMVIRGAQGIYRALKSGTTTLTAQGDPFCLQATPPCGAPSRMFSVTVDVH